MQRKAGIYYANMMQIAFYVISQTNNERCKPQYMNL